MKNRPLSAKQKLQITYATNQTFKRNKNYINLDDHNISIQQSILRRIPHSPQSHLMTQKITTSFLNTTISINQRSLRIFSKTKAKSNLPSQQLQSSLSPTHKKSRSFSFQKMTSRTYHHNLHNKPVPDQRRFNNYSRFQSKTPIFCNFSKMTGKQINRQSKISFRSQYDTQHLYKQFYLKNQQKMCFVDYKSQKNMKRGRVFYSPKRVQDTPSTDLNPQNIAKGEKIFAHNKSAQIKPISQQQFYILSGRQYPSQIQLRYMNPLNNYWYNQLQQKKITNNNNFFKSKANDQLKNQRLEKIKFFKKIKNNRHQMCDQKFFRRFKK